MSQQPILFDSDSRDYRDLQWFQPVPTIGRPINEGLTVYFEPPVVVVVQPSFNFNPEVAEFIPDMPDSPASPSSSMDSLPDSPPSPTSSSESLSESPASASSSSGSLQDRCVGASCSESSFASEYDYEGVPVQPQGVSRMFGMKRKLEDDDDNENDCVYKRRYPGCDGEHVFGVCLWARPIHLSCLSGLLVFVLVG